MSSDPGGGHSEILAAVADASDDAIVVTDLDGIVLYWTTAAARLYGYTAEQIVGQSVAALWPEGQRGEIASILQHTRGKANARRSSTRSAARSRDASWKSPWRRRPSDATTGR